MNSAKLIPEPIAIKLPCIPDSSSLPKKNKTIPEKQNISAIRFFFSNFVFRNIGSRIRRYIGAVNCRKIAFATLVSFAATTNIIRTKA